MISCSRRASFVTSLADLWSRLVDSMVEEASPPNYRPCMSSLVPFRDGGSRDSYCSGLR